MFDCLSFPIEPIKDVLVFSSASFVIVCKEYNLSLHIKKKENIFMTIYLKMRIINPLKPSQLNGDYF